MARSAPSASAGIERKRRALRIAESLLTVEPAGREALLDAEANGDPELRRRVLELLSDETGMTTEPATPASLDPEPDRAVGDRLGPYRVVQVLGQGGMGKVYLAERVDGEVERRVAIKVIAAQKDGSRVRRRFLGERQILAGLDHPNIARMFDAGTTEDGRPFLVMEAVDGVPVDRFCRERRWDLDQRLELFRKVAAAVGHAHQRLVVHRDLKPSNILVSADGEPKLLDFGIAKLLDPAVDAVDATRTGQQGAMTPAWASPEQLQGRPVTTATDVYALGLLLYKLLTGRLPHDPTVSLFDLARRGFESEAPGRPSEHLKEPAKTALQNWPGQDPRKVRRRLVGDLDNIVQKALRPDPSDRYPSVDALLEDLRRLETGEPVSATRDTFFYVTRKFVGRHRAPLAGLALIMGLTAGFAVVTQRQSEAVAASAREAAEEAERARITKEFLADLLGAADEEARANKRIDLKSVLDTGLERIRSGEIEDPVIKAELLETLADGYVDLALYSIAIGLYLEAENLIVCDGPAEESEDLARILAKKGFALVEAGQIREGKILLSGLGTNDPGLKERIQADLSHASLTQGLLYQSALKLHEELEVKSMKLSGDLLGKELVTPLYYLSSALINAGQLKSALSLIEDLFRLERYLGSNAPLSVDNLARVHCWKQNYAACEEIFEMAVVIDQIGLESKHLHDPTAATNYLLWGRVLGALDRPSEAVEKIELAFDRTRDLVALDRNQVRARYQVGLGNFYLAEIQERAGRTDETAEHLRMAREVLEDLLQEHDDIVFIRNTYAMTLLMQDNLEAAKPIVEQLLWDGWRRPDFMRLAEEKGVLPDPMPPPLDLPTELPPKLQAYLDSLPDVPLPGEEGFDPEMWRPAEPSG